MNSKLLTIISICLNNRSGIDKTVKSILDQKNSLVEYIVIDGGSTDGSVEVVKSYQSSIDIFISEPDSGIYNAINKGIKLASGKFIELVHSGDTLRPDVLPRILKTLANNSNFDGVYYGAIITTLNNAFVNVVGPNYTQLVDIMIPHPATFVSKSLYEKYGLYDESYTISGDYKKFLQFYIHRVPFVWLDEIVVDFDLSGSSSNWELARKENKRAKVELGILPRDKFLNKKYQNLKNILRNVLDFFLEWKS